MPTSFQHLTLLFCCYTMTKIALGGERFFDFQVRALHQGEPRRDCESAASWLLLGSHHILSSVVQGNLPRDGTALLIAGFMS